VAENEKENPTPEERALVLHRQTCDCIDGQRDHEASIAAEIRDAIRQEREILKKKLSGLWIFPDIEFDDRDKGWNQALEKVLREIRG